MDRNIKIFEVNSLLYFILRASFIGLTITNLINISKVDSYLCPLIGGIVGLVFLIFYFKILNINPSQNIAQNILTYFGQKIGSVINCLLCLLVFIFSILLFYDLINFIGSEYLFNTPDIAIGILCLIPIIYILTKGLKVLCKTSSILFFLSIILYLLSVIGLFAQGNLSNLLPFLENGIHPVISGTISYIAYNILPIFLLCIIPKNNINNNTKFEKKAIIFYLIINFINFSVLFNILSVLGIDLASLYQYPDYQVLRRISIGGFVERIESLIAIQWMFCIFILLVLCFYYINSTIKESFKIKKNIIFSFIIPIVSIILSLSIFKNNTIANNYITFVGPSLLVISFFVIPFIIYLFMKLKRT